MRFRVGSAVAYHRIDPEPFDAQKQNRLWYLAVLLKKQKLVKKETV